MPRAEGNRKLSNGLKVSVILSSRDLFYNTVPVVNMVWYISRVKSVDLRLSILPHTRKLRDDTENFGRYWRCLFLELMVMELQVFA